MGRELVGRGDILTANPVDIVGGKGYNSIRLADPELSRKLGYSVPEFRIVTVGVECTSAQAEQSFRILRAPLIARSSSPVEDSHGFSFAGRFDSISDINDVQYLQGAIQRVRDSAKSARAIEYARRHGLEIDDRMAVMVQEWIRDPLVSGVGYSDTDPDNPKIMLEFVERETSERMMSGDQQGVIVSCDVDSHVQHVGGAWSASLGASGLDKVAVVVKGLEEDFGERLDVEFIVAKDKRIYVIQARSVTDPDWPGVQIPEVEESRIILESNIVRGAGVFTGPAFVLQPGFLFQVGQHLELRDFNKNHPEGYCLIAENLKGHEAMLENNGLSNMRALVTVDYASRFSHPIKVVSETGAFYLGVLGRRDILRTVITGDTLTVTADQSSGLIYDHVVPALEPVTPVVERYLIDLADVTKISFQTGLKMQNPPYEEVDENLFVAGDGEIGVLFDDYNENETNGAPEKVYYRFIDMSGFVIGSGVYDIDTSDRMLKFDNFPALLKYLLYLARIKKTSQS